MIQTALYKRGIIMQKIMNKDKHDNVFISLLKHKTESKRTQKENFLTESFAFLLRKNEKLLAFLLKRMLEDTSGRVNKQAYVVKTQKPIKKEEGYKYPDIAIFSDKTIIFIENKVESNLPSDQMRNYKQYLNGCECSKYSVKKLITLTKYPQQCSYEDKNILWLQVYEWIQEWAICHCKENGLYRELVHDFLQFLGSEELGMKPVKLSVGDGKVVEEYGVLNEGIRQLIRYVESGVREKYGWKKSKDNPSKGVSYWHDAGAITPKGIKFRILFILHAGDMHIKSKIWFWIDKTHKRPDLRIINELKAKYGYYNDLGGVFKDLKFNKDFFDYPSSKQNEILLQHVLEELDKLKGLI